MLLCSVSPTPRTPFFLPCERDSVISIFFRQTWHVLSFLLHLFNDPDIAMEHTYCTVGSPLLDMESCSTTTKSTVHVKLCAEKGLHLSADSWEFGVLVQSRDEMKMPFMFLLPLALLIGTLVVF